MEHKEKVLELLGVLVVAYDEGLQLGKVSDIYLDKGTCQLTGLSFKKGFPGFADDFYVEFKHIRKMGRDVVLVTSQAAVKPLPRGVAKTSLRLLKNVRIATQGGAYVGMLSDVSVAVESGRVSRLILSENRRINVEPKTTAIGADLIVLPSDHTVDTVKAEPRHSGAAKNIEAMSHLLESATSKVVTVAKGTSDRVVQTTKRTADTVKGASGTAKGTPRTATPPARPAKTTKRAKKTTGLAKAKKP